MKTTLIILLFFITTSYTNKSDNDSIPLNKFKKTLCKDWLYEYSITNGKKEVISNEVFVHGLTNVFFRIVFRNMNKTELERFYRNNPEYINLLKGNFLEGIEMFGDYKGCPEYILLKNNLKENLLDIQTYGTCNSGPPTKWKSFRIEKLTKDTLVLAGYMGETLENKLIYSRIK
jgi:hypothetical protein